MDGSMARTSFAGGRNSGTGAPTVLVLDIQHTNYEENKCLDEAGRLTNDFFKRKQGSILPRFPSPFRLFL
jgi:hypothetical protein